MPKIQIPVETLIEQLHGADWTARCDAARLLGQSKDPRAVDALLPDLNDPDWRVRRNAAQALGALHDPRAVEPLLLALKDQTMTVRQRAIVALGRIKDLRALPVLIEILLENRRESYDAAKAIRKLGKKALPELVKAFERTHDQQLMLLLIELKYEGAFELLLRLLQGPGLTVPQTAIREMGKLGDQRAIPYLTPYLNSDNPISQMEAARALGKLNAREAAPLLLDLLIDDELYGPRSGIYHAVAEAFQMFGGVTTEMKDAFPGNYPAMFNMGGAPISLPEAMGLIGNNPLQAAVPGLQDEPAREIEMPPGIPSDLFQKVFEELSWKFGVMFADAGDARQDRVRRLLQLLRSESDLTRAAAALTLPWYTVESSLAALGQATQDPAEVVRRSAAWAFRALQKALLYRNQRGL